LSKGFKKFLEKIMKCSIKAASVTTACVCQVESAEKGLEKVHNPISTVFFIKGLF